MLNINDEDASRLSAPLLPQLEKTRYGSSANTAITILQKSPLILNDKACLVVRNSNTVYKNGKPRTEFYEIRIMSSCTISAQPLSGGVWRTFKEFRWLRGSFQKQYRHQKMPCLPPNYLFRRNYDQDVVRERMKGLQEFLEECLQLKYIVSELMFHLFVQTNLSIEDIKQQQSKKDRHLFFMCFWACSSRKSEENDNNTVFSDNNEDIDYNEFKKELEIVLKENEEEEKEDSTKSN